MSTPRGYYEPDPTTCSALRMFLETRGSPGRVTLAASPPTTKCAPGEVSGPLPGVNNKLETATGRGSSFQPT